MSLTRDEILFSIDKPSVHGVNVDGLGYVFIRTMTGTASMALRKKLESDEAVLGAWLMRYAVCDEVGRLMFSDTDVPKLAELPLGVLNTIGKLISSHNGMGQEDVEVLEKN